LRDVAVLSVLQRHEEEVFISRAAVAAYEHLAGGDCLGGLWHDIACESLYVDGREPDASSEHHPCGQSLRVNGGKIFGLGAVCADLVDCGESEPVVGAGVRAVRFA
jgi:hypothetical protein